MSIHLESQSYLKKSQDLGASQDQAQDQQRIQLPHRQGHVTLPQGYVHLDPSGATTTTTAGAGQRLLTARERDALIEDLKLEVETRIRKLRSHHELAARALRAKIEMRINRVPRRYWDLTLRELQQLPRGATAGAGSSSTNSPRKPGADGIRITKAASTGSTKPKPSISSGTGSLNSGGKSSTASTAAAAIRRTGRAAGARHGMALSPDATARPRGLTRNLRSRGN
ncbi:hypothetical protein D0Z00_003937 [Geotrichum galactomycetum]|uniref:Uncharacterized protein n=1 Tax=Geotrichum galactomycetum TaxID=27317 RepID=A0ACB6UZR4_9ASCO|nr:hypothetical protein D0Z00_003937 [Geotrichum candidum]